MATRSRLIININGLYKSVYVHWDGHPRYRMPLLLEHFNNDTAVKRFFEPYINNSDKTICRYGNSTNNFTNKLSLQTYSGGEVRESNFDDRNLGRFSEFFIADGTAYLVTNTTDDLNMLIESDTLQGILDNEQFKRTDIDFIYIYENNTWRYAHIAVNENRDNFIDPDYIPTEYHEHHIKNIERVYNSPDIFN